MHICISKLAIIGSDNGLSPAQRQDIIWTHAGILSTEPLGINFSEIFIQQNAFESVVWRPFCLGLNVLTQIYVDIYVITRLQRVITVWWVQYG